VKALIIDDNELNLDVLATLLTYAGMTPITLQSPDAIAAVIDNESDISIIFLDLEFPDHDGLTIIKQLQADVRLHGIPITAYTVHISEQNEAREAGFHSFLGKPLNVQRFPNQLQRILNGERVWEVD
jgi:two-component system, cell cycle response regulator DivK